MRSLIIILFLLLNAFADSYNMNVINIHAKVFPKILFTDTKIEDKLVDGTIKIIILYTKNDIQVANTLKKEMLRFYPLIKGHPLWISLQEYEQFDPAERATAYYELLGDKESVIKVNKVAQKNALITFAYDSGYLDYGTLMSLYISNAVAPYISIKVLKQSNIVLDNIIYKIAKIK